VNAHGKAYHIDCFLNVGLPVAALLAVVNLVDYDIVLLLAVGRDVKCGEPRVLSSLCYESGKPISWSSPQIQVDRIKMAWM